MTTPTMEADSVMLGDHFTVDFFVVALAVADDVVLLAVDDPLVVVEDALVVAEAELVSVVEVDVADDVVEADVLEAAVVDAVVASVVVVASVEAAVEAADVAAAVVVASARASTAFLRRSSSSELSELSGLRHCSMACTASADSSPEHPASPLRHSKRRSESDPAIVRQCETVLASPQEMSAATSVRHPRLVIRGAAVTGLASSMARAAAERVGMFENLIFAAWLR